MKRPQQPGFYVHASLYTALVAWAWITFPDKPVVPIVVTVLGLLSFAGVGYFR